MNLDSLLNRLFDLLFGRGHLPSCSPVQYLHILAQTFGDPGRIYGSIPSTYHSHPLTNLNIMTKINLPQEIHRIDDLRQVFTLDSHLQSLVCSGSNKYRIILRPEIRELDIYTYRRVCLDIHTQFLDLLNVPVQSIPGQTVIRYTDYKHAANNRL